MNQGKLEVVKQEMARVNVNSLGISELKWTGMGEYNSDDHYLLLWARIPHKKWRSHHRQQKESEMWYLLGCNLKNDRMISVHAKANHSISW